MNKNIDQDKVVARIPMSNDIFMDSLEGRKVSTDLPEIEKVCELIETKKKSAWEHGTQRTCNFYDQEQKQNKSIHMVARCPGNRCNYSWRSCLTVFLLLEEVLQVKGLSACRLVLITGMAGS